MQNIDLTNKRWNLVSHIKMGKEVLMLYDIEIGKKNYYHKTPILLKDVHIEKVLASNQIFACEKNYKYFIRCLYNDHIVKPFFNILPERTHM